MCFFRNRISIATKGKMKGTRKGNAMETKGKLLKVYQAVWEAIGDNGLSVDSSDPAPMPEREDAVNADNTQGFFLHRHRLVEMHTR